MLGGQDTWPGRVVPPNIRQIGQLPSITGCEERLTSPGCDQLALHCFTAVVSDSSRGQEFWNDPDHRGLSVIGKEFQEAIYMKRILAVNLLLICTVVFMAACAAPTGTDTNAEPTKNSGEYYSTWTKSDWEEASPQEKQLAVLFLVEEAVASQGSDEEVVQSIVDEAEETLTDEQYDEIENAITSYFDKAKEGADLQSALGDVKGTISKYVAIG